MCWVQVYLRFKIATDLPARQLLFLVSWNSACVRMRVYTRTNIHTRPCTYVCVRVSRCTHALVRVWLKIIWMRESLPFPSKKGELMPRKIDVCCEIPCTTRVHGRLMVPLCHWTFSALLVIIFFIVLMCMWFVIHIKMLFSVCCFFPYPGIAKQQWQECC